MEHKNIVRNVELQDAFEIMLSSDEANSQSLLCSGRLLAYLIHSHNLKIFQRRNLRRKIQKSWIPNSTLNGKI